MPIQKLPIKFCPFKGSNITLLNDYIAKANYEVAHGQFLLQNELIAGQTFDLEIRGKGILKIQAFDSKRDAIMWVNNQAPLSHGSIRIRTTNLFYYKISVPLQGNEIILSTRKGQRQDRLEGKILAFDIEYGDLIVMVLNEQNNNYVGLDENCKSRHIEINCAPKLSHAYLKHYNPSSLCTPESGCLRPGDQFKLEVHGPEGSNQTGSYLRVCVSRRHCEYGNDPLLRCEGTPTLPEYKGKRLMIKPKAKEMFILNIVDNWVFVHRSGREYDRLEVPVTTSDLAIYFEMYRVEIRLWRLRVVPFGENKREDCPPNYPAPPPPRRIPRRQASVSSTGFSELQSSFCSSDSGSHHYISIQRDNEEASAYISAESVQGNSLMDHLDFESSQFDSGETYRPGVPGFSAVPRRSPPLPPKPHSFSSKGKPVDEVKPPVPPRRPPKCAYANKPLPPLPFPKRLEVEKNERCLEWVQSLDMSDANENASADNGHLASSVSTDSSFMINYSCGDNEEHYRHELNITDIQAQHIPIVDSRLSNGTLSNTCNLPDSPTSMSSLDSQGFFQVMADCDLQGNPPPCGSAKKMSCGEDESMDKILSDSMDSESNFSEMSTDETDVKTVAKRKIKNLASGADSDTCHDFQPFFKSIQGDDTNPYPTPSTTESESEEGACFVFENELNREDEGVTLRRSTLHDRNIVESSVINYSQCPSPNRIEGHIATIEQGPVLTIPSNLAFERSPTFRRNLNTSSIKRHNSKEK